MPSVSVVIPTRNRTQLLLRAVRSVLAQTYQDFELVLVVDGPDPDTTEVLSTIDDPRLLVYSTDVSRGSSGARNFGAEAAAGRWIAFLDDDDEWLPRKLELQTALALRARDPDSALVTSLTQVITPHAEFISPRQIYDGQMPFDEWLFDRPQVIGGFGFFQTSSMMISTSLFRSIGCFTTRKRHDDWDIAIRATKHARAEVLTVPEVLVRHYVEDGRISVAQGLKLKESLDWLEQSRPLLTRKAYSGFCLTILPDHARRVGGFAVFFDLLVRAFRYGAPTLVQLAVFFAVCGSPRSLRRRVRSWHHVRTHAFGGR